MRRPLREIDRPLAAVALALAAYGLATVYSAGQTDAATFVTTLWHKQAVWLAIGVVAAVLMFRVSPPLLEWATPYAYGLSVAVLLFTLLAGRAPRPRAVERSSLRGGGGG